MSKREDLIKQFNESVRKLYPLIKKRPGGKMGVFLHQSIIQNADEETLEKILKDVNKFIRLWDKKEK